MDILFKSRFTVDFNENPGYLCLEIASVNDTTDNDLSDNQKCITTGKDFQVFEVYPNPFVDQINLGLNIPSEGEVTISLYNVAGKKVKNTESKTFPKGYNSIVIEGSGLEAGVYISEIRFKDNTIVKKLVRYRN